MSDNPSRPELVIAIDFGMTCTGVAFCNIATGEESVRWIQKWPGRSSAVENKVPTVLVYPKNSTIPSSWGFLSETSSEQMSQDKECKEWFKTFLDEDRFLQFRRDAKNREVCPESIQEVERLCCDFFAFLYQTIQQKLKNEVANRWEDANIEFIFSVPTTWKPVPTIERFRSTINRAGFGSFPNHKVEIGLTEAEAAAVHTARAFPRLFNERDVLLVCDVGGGTTDLSVLRVTNTGGIGSVSLEQMDVVQGATIGSVQLDTAFEASVRNRLEMANRIQPTGLQSEEIDDIAWQMVKSRDYQNAKCDYDILENDATDYYLTIPKIHRGYVNEHVGIIHGDLRLKRDEMQGYFDAQIVKLFELIDKQIIRLQQKFPQEQVAHLVLSGGLGNSAYVQRRLAERYSFSSTPFPNARFLQVRVAPDPQLVVCKGIVADRVTKIRTNKSVLEWRCCRASYGTVCKVLFDPQDPQHFGQPTQKDSFDGKLYIPDCITWFIRQGEPVSIDYPIVRQFSRKCPPATPFDPNPIRMFPTAIISSEVNKDMLPLVMNSSCQKICDITSDFSGFPLSMFKMKNRHWWNMGKKYHRINYAIKVSLGAADIRFELWHNGMKLSKDNPIRIEWYSTPAPEPQPQPLNRFNSFGEQGQWQPAGQSGIYGQAYLPQQQSQLHFPSQSPPPPPPKNTWNSAEQWPPAQRSGIIYGQPYNNMQ